MPVPPPKPGNEGDLDLLALYLQDHYAASTGGLELFRRAARGLRDPAARAELDRLAGEVADDRQELREVMTAVGARPSPLKHGAAWLAEKAARLKPNGMLLRRSPLSDVVELEALQVALTGQRAGWTALRELAETGRPIDQAKVDRQLTRTDDQLARVDRLRLAAARTAFTSSDVPGPVA